MWKYTHTDEMYHSLTNKNELFHSDTYLGQDFSDGVKHYKYIKKIPIGNGKFRYIYDIKDTYNNSNGRYEKIGGKKASKYGTYTKTNKDGGKSTYIVKKSNKLFSEKTGSSISVNHGPRDYTTVHNVGRLRQNYDYVSDKVKKATSKTKKKIEKAKTKAKVTKAIDDKAAKALGMSKAEYQLKKAKTKAKVKIEKAKVKSKVRKTVDDAAATALDMNPAEYQLKKAKYKTEKALSKLKKKYLRKK